MSDARPRAPFTGLAPRARRRLAVALAASTLVVAALLAWLDAPLAHDAAPRGIVSFELAGSAADARAVLAGWDAPERVRAGLALGLDALFLLLYPALLALLAAGPAARLGGAAARAGAVLAWAVLLAAPLDAVENAALAHQLLAGPDEAAARLAALCAVPKFALVAAAALYGVGAALVLGLRVLRRRRAVPVAGGTGPPERGA